MNDRPSEFDFIKTYFAPLSRSVDGAFDLTDDAASLDVPDGQKLIVTTDAIVEGVHFLDDDDPENVAAKLLRVSLSDLASMGAQPAYYSLAMSVSSGLQADWFERFAEQLAEDQQTYGIHLIGGDTVASKGPLTLSLTAMGFVEKGQELRRNGAEPGDDIWVTGTIGDGALGLLAAQNKLAKISTEAQSYLKDRYRRPQPRTEFGKLLVGNATAAIDISDGLIADLGHICDVSSVGADIQVRDIPLSNAAREAFESDPDLLDLILSGGDDYELLFTANPARSEKIVELSSDLNIAATMIGKIETTESIRVFDQAGSIYTPSKTGFTHF